MENITAQSLNPSPLNRKSRCSINKGQLNDRHQMINTNMTECQAVHIEQGRTLAVVISVNMFFFLINSNAFKLSTMVYNMFGRISYSPYATYLREHRI